MVKAFPDLWSRFLTKLGSIEFFSNLSKAQRETWLFENQSDEDIYFEDVEGLEMSIQQVGNNDLLKLPPKYLEKVSRGIRISVFELYNQFPRKPGSEGIGAKKRHTLIFRRDIWRIFVIYRTVKTFNGPVIDVQKGVVLNGAQAKPKEDLYVFDSFTGEWRSKARTTGYASEQKQSVGFLVRKEAKPKPEDYIKVMNLRYNGTLEDYNTILKATKSFTAAAYKSLLQKIVRFRPEEVHFSDVSVYDSNYALAATFTILVNTPGSFVPDIQRFVTGVESALKRLVVIAYEDSYFPPNKSDQILSFTASAFLAQRIPGWKVPMETFKKGLELLDSLLNEERVFIHDIPAGIKAKPYIVTTNQHSLITVSALMDELRSFAGDLGMIRNSGLRVSMGTIKTEGSKIRPKFMPLEHCIDQHWAPEVIYFYPKEMIQREKVSGSKPYSGIIYRLFHEVTGVNPRRKEGGYSSNFETRPFIKTTRKSQSLVLMSRSAGEPNEKTRLKSKGFYELNYELDRSWISGLMGTVEVKGRPPALVTLHPDDPEIFVAVRKPSRNMKTAFLTDQRESEVIDKVKYLLGPKGSGVPLNQTTAPIPKLKGARLTYLHPKGASETEFYILTKSRDLKRWEDFRKGSIDIPYLQDIPLTLTNAISYVTTGGGIVHNADLKLKKLLTQYTRKEIQRAMMYISSYSGDFEFARISRDGGGTKQAVSIEDVAAYQLVLLTSILYPSALTRKPKTTLKYLISVGPLLWHIKDIYKDYISGNVETISAKEWGDIGEKQGRVMWEHQVSSVKEMKAAHRQGRKGHFIWVPVGLGKSKQTFAYLEWLLKSGQLPKYIIYTLPSSAINSVMNEIRAYGFDLQLMVPLKTLSKSDLYRKSNGQPQDYVVYGSNACTPKAYAINLVEHDHLRRCTDILPSYMADSIFVIDEVHKALNNTIRTAVALQLSYLAQEFIAMTGTPIVDTNTYKLIWWLEQIVAFGVNEKNYWVAANGMIAKKVNTGVKVDKKDTLVQFTIAEEKAYQILVPPALGGTNAQPRSEDLRKAVDICYQTATRGMIDETLKYLKQGRGVFLVADSLQHQTILQDRLLGNGVKTKDIFLITKDTSIFLTDEVVAAKKAPDYKVVITTKRKSEGYTLTRLSVMITSVYPSNNATREQLEGRINRIGQKEDTVIYRVIHCGILTYILKRHNDARNLSAVLSSLADDIALE